MTASSILSVYIISSGPLIDKQYQFGVVVVGAAFLRFNDVKLHIVSLDSVAVVQDNLRVVVFHILKVLHSATPIV